MRTAMIALLIWASAVPATAQNVENPLVVQVGVFNVRADGTVGGYAVDVGERVNEPISSLVWAGNGGCAVGAADLDGGEKREPPDRATDAWEVRGQVITLTPEQATVQLEWRRLKASGAAGEGAWTSRQVVVSLNELVPLDAIVHATGDCAPRSVAFGARFAARFPSVPSAGFRGGSGSGSVSGRSTGTTSGSGGGGLVGARPSVPSYDAEMWLVHSVPGKPDVHAALKIRLDGGWTKFSFAPVRFPAPGGTLEVALNGSLRLMRSDEAGGLSYILTGQRTVTFTPATAPGRDPRDPLYEKAGFTNSKALPGAEEVIAYEMPELRVPGGPAVPDKFTIRLRLRPVRVGN